MHPELVILAQQRRVEDLRRDAARYALVREARGASFRYRRRFPRWMRRLLAI